MKHLIVISLVISFAIFAKAETSKPETDVAPAKVLELQSSLKDFKSIENSDLTEEFEKIPDFDKNSVQNDAELDADEQLVD